MRVVCFVCTFAFHFFDFLVKSTKTLVAEILLFLYRWCVCFVCFLLLVLESALLYSTSCSTICEVLVVVDKEMLKAPLIYKCITE